MAASLPDASFATCIAAVIDTSDGSCVIAAAGHPPPVVAQADGVTQVLDLPSGLPLGLGAGSFQETRVRLPPAPRSRCIPKGWWRPGPARWKRASARCAKR